MINSINLLFIKLIGKRMFDSLQILNNESDVEQKFIVPLLTEDYFGLGYRNIDFITKNSIKPYSIGKGKSKKIYYPDYIIVINGLPLIIIEAKSPDQEDLTQAYDEARLYASELNAEFRAGINPCQKVIATNGKAILVGNWDCRTPDLTLKFDEINYSNENYHKFLKLVSREQIQKISKSLLEEVRGNVQYRRPTQLLGGRAIQNSEMQPNTFGLTISLDYRHLFDPRTRDERKNIVENAYVASKKRQKHVSPIERIIRSIKLPSVVDAKELNDSSNPDEIYKAFENDFDLRKKNELVILVGNVGSGKSTFTDYLRDIALPKSIKDSTLWVNVNLNNAPISKEMIYDWLIQEVINQLKGLHPSIDFEEKSIIEKIYGIEINSLKKGILKFLENDETEYNRLLVQNISEYESNIKFKLKCLVRFLCAQRGKTLVLVLDNCDKRDRDSQLLMFEVATWFKREYESILFLPMRDTTYDMHRREPPLDTCVKDLVFRIDPPPLIDVLYRRMKYALAEMKKTSKESSLFFTLPNDIRVNYPNSDQGFYLACILRSLFQTDTFFKRLIAGIAGRNIRKGIEIFLDFCKSGHIGEDQILKIRHAKGDYILPSHIVTRVLIRGNRRYYSDANAKLKNLFFSKPEDSLPNPFSRLIILRWLKKKMREKGPTNIMGFHRVLDLYFYLTPFGHNRETIKEEIINLLKADCIASESQDIDNIMEEDLISITPCGIVHLELLNNLDYLSSCSEDVWYRDNKLAEQIAERIGNKTGRDHYSYSVSTENSSDLVNYLISYSNKFEFISEAKTYLKDENFEDLTNLSNSMELIEKAKKGTIESDDNIEVLKESYPPGKIINGQIVSVQDYGIFVVFDLKISGLIHISNINIMSDSELMLFENFEVGDHIIAEIISYNPQHRRFSLKHIPFEELPLNEIQK